MSKEIIQLPDGSFKVNIFSRNDYKNIPAYKKVFFVQKGIAGKNGDSPLVCLKNNIDKKELIIAFSSPDKVITFFDFFKNNPAKTRYSAHSLPIIEINLEEFFKSSSPDQLILLDPPNGMHIPYF